VEWGAPEQADGASGEKAERTHLAFGGRVRWQAQQNQSVAGPGIGESHTTPCRRRLHSSGCASEPL